MELNKLLSPARIRVPLQATTKLDAITELVNLLHETGGLIDRDNVLEAVLKRESERTTGIGYGLAIPHGKSNGVRNLVMAAGKPQSPIDFKSLDGRPVSYIFLLISPHDQTSAHIQALAKISRLMNFDGFRTALAQAGSSQELFDAVATAEASDIGAR